MPVRIFLVYLHSTLHFAALEWVLKYELILLSELALPDCSISLNNVSILQALFILHTLVIFDSSLFLDVLKQLLNSMDSFFAV